MNLNKEDIDLLDRQIKGLLTEQDRTQLNERLSADESFRTEAEEYLMLINELKAHDDRSKLKAMVGSAHAELQEPSLVNNEITLQAARKRWMFPAMAAAIAILGMASVFLITSSWKNEQSEQYRELRRNVEQIRKSQTLIMKDLQKKNAAPTRETFAGSGFLISAGYVSTSNHVVKEADSIYIENDKFGRLKAIVVYRDAATDIAILKINPIGKGRQLPPYAISNREAQLAEEVFTLGFPREDVVFGSGTISASTGYQGNPDAYQISVPVNPGNSGGPLFNSKGDVIGMISGKQMEIAGAAFATKSTTMLQMLSARAPDSIRTSLLNLRKTTQSVSSRVSQVNVWRDYVFVVKVYKN